MNYLKNNPKTISLIITALLLIPFVSYATVFENPVGANSITGFFQGLIRFLASITPIAALLALVYGGLRLAGASAISESEVSRAKQIILYAIIGFIITGMAATIVWRVGKIL